VIDRPAYLMEDPREARRLADKLDPAIWVGTYLDPLMVDGMRVLDVGCGPGTIAAHIARLLPGTHVVGLDSSPTRLHAAEEHFRGLPNAAVRNGDATALPFGDSTFDLVYSRFLLEYLTEPARTVTEMVRVCRPGGVVLLQDLDGQLVSHYPPVPELQAGIEAAMTGLAKTGFDPFVGRRLFHLAHTAGLTDLEVRVEGYHLIAGQIDQPTRRRWELKLDIALQAAAHALGSHQAAADLQAQFLAYLDRDDTLTWSQLFTVWGARCGCQKVGRGC
jgi:SAM-dependent methyltransferase